MAALVKICGLRDRDAIQTALAHGADYLGFIFYPPSPRALSVTQAAELLAPLRTEIHRAGAEIVAVTVNAEDMLLQEIITLVRPDILQFHGDETPEHLRSLRHAFPQRFIKALPIRNHKDLALAETFADAADYLLLDAPAPAGEYGGTGKVFDWKLLGEWECPRPCFLSGGLNPANVTEAIRTTRAHAVDVSSGVEKSKGVKDPAAIRAFLEAAKSVE